MKASYNKLKRYLHDIAKIKKSPNSIALGFSIGAFISILPTPGFNILLGFLVILLYKNVNKISLFGSMALFNPLTLIPIYMWSYRIGNLIFGKVPIVEYKITILQQIYNFSRRFLIGNIILATIISLLSYVLVRYAAQAVQRKISE